MSAFIESKQFEQGRAAVYDKEGNLVSEADSFYLTGSTANFGNDPKSFSSSLANKKMIRMSFDVDRSTKMLAQSSSIYYYDARLKMWRYPTQQEVPTPIPQLPAGPFDKISFNTISPITAGDWPTFLSSDGTRGSILSEDRIGFDCYGNPIASGSLDLVRHDTTSYTQSSKYIRNLYSRRNLAELMTLDLPKSLFRSDDYKPTDGQVFELPISEPFLINKVVFEIPLCLGNGWFNDKTTTLISSASSFMFGDPDPLYDGFKGYSSYPSWFIDEGGPALTLSLMCEKNYGTGSIRDLVTYETVTHTQDFARPAMTYMFSGSYSPAQWLVSIINGFPYGKEVTKISGEGSVGEQQFTGSIVVKSEPKISNGIKGYALTLIDFYNSEAGAEEALVEFNKFLDKKYISNACVISGMNVFGRGMTGFMPSGGSIFGRECVTTGSMGVIPNPFYLDTESPLDAVSRIFLLGKTSDYIQQTLEVRSGGDGPIATSALYCLYPVDLNARTPSPYLVNPGDKLILGMSKTRPAIESYAAALGVRNGDITEDQELRVYNGNISVYSSSYYNPVPEGHDVKFNTGSINITFYGSYVSNNGEYTR